MTTQYQSKEQQTSEQSKEYSKTEQKYTKEHFTANQGRTDVVVEKNRKCTCGSRTSPPSYPHGYSP